MKAESEVCPSPQVVDTYGIVPLGGFTKCPTCTYFLNDKNAKLRTTKSTEKYDAPMAAL